MQARVLYEQYSTNVSSVRLNMHVANSLLTHLLYSKISIALALSSQESLVQTEPLTPYQPVCLSDPARTAIGANNKDLLRSSQIHVSFPLFLFDFRTK